MAADLHQMECDNYPKSLLCYSEEVNSSPPSHLSMSSTFIVEGNDSNLDWKKHIPMILITFRFFSGPLLLYDAYDGQVQRLFWSVLFSLAVLSDVLDGIVARALKVDSKFLRELDSRADVTLYIFVALSMWCAHRDALVKWRCLLIAMLISHFAQWTAAFAKYGKLASYHSWTAKIWGATLGFATGFLFAFDEDRPLVVCSLWGVIHNSHEILMTVVLPEWKHDVWDIREALRLRQGHAQHGHYLDLIPPPSIDGI
jgi:CDP-diacylglycerol--glycerol-3-phosphate 3-phosphatidyltransferase